MLHAPVLLLTPSNTTVCVDSGTCAPPAPPLVFDQLLESDQFPVDDETQ